MILCYESVWCRDGCMWTMSIDVATPSKNKQHYFWARQLVDKSVYKSISSLKRIKLYSESLSNFSLSHMGLICMGMYICTCPVYTCTCPVYICTCPVYMQGMCTRIQTAAQEKVIHTVYPPVTNAMIMWLCMTVRQQAHVLGTVPLFHNHGIVCACKGVT